MADPTVVRSDEQSRFEAVVDGLLAKLEYRESGDRITLVHTEVPEELEGHGLGGALVEAALEDAAQRSLTVVPSCPFARSWMRRHPDRVERVRVDWPS